MFPSRRTEQRFRLVLTACLAVYGVVCLLDPGTFRLLDNVDLAIHETGHIVFAPFGEFLGFLGGTLLQLIFPITFGWYFWRRRDRHAATVALWWVAQNLWNISVYVGDARRLELPLVGAGEHDWNYLLDRVGLLAHDVSIARGVHAAGVLVFLSAIFWGLATARASSGRRAGAG